MSAVGRLLERHETKEGADGGQTQVARPDAGAAPHLEIGQERANERRLQIVERQGRRGLAEPRLREREQQPECIPIRCDRIGADIALTHEPFGEVTLDQRGDVVARLHGPASHR